jgi:hypothetical protein
LGLLLVGCQGTDSQNSPIAEYGNRYDARGWKTARISYFWATLKTL